MGTIQIMLVTNNMSPMSLATCNQLSSSITLLQSLYLQDRMNDAMKFLDAIDFDYYAKSNK